MNIKAMILNQRYTLTIPKEVSLLSQDSGIIPHYTIILPPY